MVEPGRGLPLKAEARLFSGGLFLACLPEAEANLQSCEFESEQVFVPLELGGGCLGEKLPVLAEALQEVVLEADELRIDAGPVRGVFRVGAVGILPGEQPLLVGLLPLNP